MVLCGMLTSLMVLTGADSVLLLREKSVPCGQTASGLLDFQPMPAHLVDWVLSVQVGGLSSLDGDLAALRPCGVDIVPVIN